MNQPHDPGRPPASGGPTEPAPHPQAQPHQAPQTPAGWYPVGNGWQRYWDGLRWTEHQTPLPPQGSGPVGDDTGLAVLAHLGGYFLTIIVPIVIYVMSETRSPFLRDHAREALNFNLTLYLGFFVSFVLILVVIGFLLLPAVALFGLVVSIQAAIAAGRGESYRYPLSIRFLNG